MNDVELEYYSYFYILQISSDTCLQLNCGGGQEAHMEMGYGRGPRAGP